MEQECLEESALRLNLAKNAKVGFITYISTGNLSILMVEFHRDYEPLGYEILSMVPDGDWKTAILKRTSIVEPLDNNT